ncbi:MAG: hemolysin D [Rhizobiaceae bacterium MnEN-MB40S]|nr:MAG: hemolysin D [Rhizobiaceae bacterium MnEN-MB40S]
MPASDRIDTDEANDETASAVRRTAELKSFPATPAAADETARKPDPANDTATPEKATKTGGRSPVRRMVLMTILLLALAGGGWFGYDWWTVGRFMISTDDAYIEGDITTISPKITGYIAAVNAVENQRVKAGDPLITLDDGDYRIAAEQAKAAIATQQLTIKRIAAQIEGGRAALAQAEAQQEALEATTENARAALERASTLQHSGHVSKAMLDSAKATYEQAHANLAGAKAGILAANADIAVLKAQKAEAESTLTTLKLAADKADRDLSFTVLRAPYDGVVGNFATHEGDFVSAGQRLAALVPVDALYIDANFKETQLEGIVPGEKVDIHVDAFENETVVGTVVSISPASGSVFSLLPANNATGNFTKIVQRVPVRIALPADVLESGRLRAGLSVEVDIDSRTAPDETTLAAAIH